MITKERLLELIEQGATIYFVCNGNVDEKEGIYKDDFILNESYVSIYWSTRSHQVDYENLFETKEEAEWHREFGHIKRTEKLELPTWEEFDEIKFVWFVDKMQNQCCLYYLNVANKIFINVSGEVVEIGEFTKENYTEACRKCKKLFIGGNDA